MRCALLNENDVVIACHELDSLADVTGYVLAETCGNLGDRYDHMLQTFAPPTINEAVFFAEEKATYLDKVRDVRALILSRLNGYGAALYLKDQPAQTLEKENCANLIQSLLDITTIPSVTGAANLAQLTMAVKDEYARIVSAALPELVKAFRQAEM